MSHRRCAHHHGHTLHQHTLVAHSWWHSRASRHPTSPQPSPLNAPGPWTSLHELHQHRPARPLTAASAARSSPLTSHNTWLRNGGADGPSSPFSVLRLGEEGLANVGGAVHRRRYGGLASQEVLQMQWGEVYQEPSRPLVVDIGCGAGRFVLLAAHRGVVPGEGLLMRGQPANFLGLDQHATLMDRGNVWASARGLSSRCHYLAANAQASMAEVLATYPGPVALLAVQYPDPHYRVARHVVDTRFVQDCAALLPPGAAVLLTSDVRSTCAHMRDMFAAHGAGAFALHALHGTPGATVPDDGVEVDPYMAGYTASAGGGGGGTGVGAGGAGGGASAGAGVTEGLTSPPQSSSPPRHVVEAGLPVLPQAWVEGGWLVDNPLGGIPTEREVFAAQVTKSKVFRVMLTRLSC